jgi:hypothetical protein
MLKKLLNLYTLEKLHFKYRAAFLKYKANKISLSDYISKLEEIQLRKEKINSL